MLLPKLREIFTILPSYVKEVFRPMDVQTGSYIWQEIVWLDSSYDSEKKKIRFRQVKWASLTTRKKSCSLCKRTMAVSFEVSPVFMVHHGSFEASRAFWMPLFCVLILMDHPPCHLGVSCGQNRNEAELYRTLFKYLCGHSCEGAVQSTNSVLSKERFDLVSWIGESFQGKQI